MNKKYVITGLIVFMLTLITPLSALSMQQNHDFFDIVDKITIKTQDKNNTNDYVKGSKVFSTFIHTNDEVGELTKNLNINSTKLEVGLIKVKSTGKGFHVILPFKIFKLNAPIPTIQYHNFFPFKIDFFVTLLVYNDPNANTTLTIRGREKPVYIEGNHSLLLGMFKIPAMNLLRQLFNDGVIDGIQPIQQLYGWFGLTNISPAGIVRKIRDRIFDKFGWNITDLKDDTNEFLKYLNGVPPRYQNWNIPIFDRPWINYFRERFKQNHPMLFDALIVKTFRYWFILFPGFFWNRAPIRSSFLHFYMPQQLLGFTPFVLWSKPPPKCLHCMVKFIQNIFPNLFNDEIPQI